jgi:signal peptidase I
MKLDEKYVKWEYWWNEWVKPILIAAVLALIIRTFLIQPFKIPSSSMFPTLKPGDRIFVSKIVYGPIVPFTGYRIHGMREPRTGDIVVFYSPVERNKYLIKRYIAGPGQTVEIKGGAIYVDGNKLARGPFNKFYYYNRGEYCGEGETIKVPEGDFFVLGDNSANSQDSRYWGFVPAKNLVGNAFLIHWPINRMRFLKDGE